MGEISRRGFIKGAGAIAVTSILFPASSVFASQAAANRTFLVINLGGGIDVLGLLQPNSAYLQSIARPTLFRNMADTNQILPINGQLGLHASFSIVKELFDAGDAAIVHGVGYDNMSRSHADAERAFARGVADINSTVKTGWMNRLAATYLNGPFSTFDFSGGHHTLRVGTHRGTSIRSLDDYDFERDGTQSSQENEFRRATALSMISDQEFLKAAQIANQESWESVSSSLETIRALSIPSGYPNTNMGRQLRNVDTVMALSDATLFYTRRSGFDNHANQAGAMVNNLGEIDAALRTFINRRQTVGDWQNTTIAIVSEFGRTNHENGSFGTDHGGAGVCLLLGPGVRGGVYGLHPTEAELQQRWLSKKINFTDVMSEAVAHLGFDPFPIFGAKTDNLGLFN